MFLQFHVRAQDIPELKEMVEKSPNSTEHRVGRLLFKNDPMDNTWYWSYGEFTRLVPVVVSWPVIYIRLVAEAAILAGAGPRELTTATGVIKAYVERRDSTGPARITVKGHDLEAVVDYFHELVNGSQK